MIACTLLSAWDWLPTLGYVDCIWKMVKDTLLAWHSTTRKGANYISRKSEPHGKGNKATLVQSLVHIKYHCWNRGVIPLFNKHLNRTKKQSNLAIQFQYHCTHFPEEAHPALATFAPLNSKMVMTLEFEHVVDHKNLDITLCLTLIVAYVRIDQLLTFIDFAH
jgi:hypothetical protein